MCDGANQPTGYRRQLAAIPPGRSGTDKLMADR